MNKKCHFQANKKYSEGGNECNEFAKNIEYIFNIY